ncbi:MAG: DUF2179 domain-containing protein [Candidatus Aphodocola sp.]
MNILRMCIIIFFARVIDVSLATFVTVLTVKGKRVLATIIGFIDVLIWFLVVKEALNTDIKSIWIAFSYAGGYALGTFIGTTLSNKLIDGKISAQVIINSDSINEVEKIRKAGFAVSQIDCTGKDNAKKLMLFIELDKKHLDDLKDIINKIDKDAFMVINETKYVLNGFFK